MDSKQLKSNGVYSGKPILFPTKAIDLIISNLLENEKIIKVTSCKCDGKIGAIAVTNIRVIFGAKVLFSSQIKDFTIEKITSLNYSSSFTNKLEIKVSSDEIELSQLDKTAGQEIVNTIKSIQNPSTKTNNPSSNGLDEIEKLGELKDKGLITDEEFSQKKKQILGL